MLATADVIASDARRDATWNRYLHLMGTALCDERNPSGAGPSPQGKGKAPAISISSALGEENNVDYEW
jgi:hypothetical protein